MRVAAAALVHAIFLAVCYAPVLFGGKSVQAPLYTTSGVVPGWPPGRGGRPTINTFDVDMATPAFYEWPLDRYIGAALRRGELPLWNPHQAAGTPLVVNYSTRVFFPYQLLVDLSPFALWDFLFVLRLWIAGLATYGFLARAGLGWTPATLGGALYMLSGVFTWFVNLEQLANPAMVAPLFFLAVEAFAASPDSRRAALVAASVGLNLLAGQPEVALYVLVTGGLYGLVRWLTAYRGTLAQARRAAGWAAVAILVGFALAAPLLVPFAAHLGQSFHLHETGGDMGVRDPASPVLAVALLVPSFFELPTFERYKPNNGIWDFLGGYGGALAVFLLLAGLAGPSWPAASRWRVPLVFFGGVWIWIVLKNFGVHPFDWIGRLPLFDQVWTPRWAGPTWCLALAAGAAFGLQRYVDAGPAGAATRARVLLCVAAVLLSVGVLGGYSTRALEQAMTTHWSFVWPGAIGGQVLAGLLLVLAAVSLLRLRGGALGVALLGLVLVERWFPIPRGWAPDWLAFRLVPAGLGLFAVALLLLRQRAGATAAAAVALAVAVLLEETAPVGLPDRRDPAAVPPVVEFLRERGGHDRIMGDRRVLAPNYASVFGLYDVRYVEALAVRWFDRFVFEGLETAERLRWYSLWFTGEPERSEVKGGLIYVYPASLEHDLRHRLRGYSFLGVRYFLAPLGLDLNSRARTEGERFPVIYRNEVVVYENPAALPRAFVVGEWEHAADPGEARTRALSEGFDLRGRAVVEAPRGRPGGGRGHAGIVEYRPNSLTLDVAASGPALVVLTDTFYPGWRARVDGAPADIHRVNGVVRGVFVDGGRHRITMRFFPRSQGAGLLAGGGGLAACAAMAYRRRYGLSRAPA